MNSDLSIGLTVNPLQSEKLNLQEELMHLTTKYEQERTSASEIVKLKRSFEALEKQQEDRLAEIKKTDLGIIQAVRAQRDKEVGELKATLVSGWTRVSHLI